jgi:hypothetical protein
MSADPITGFLAQVIHQRDGLRVDLLKDLAEPERWSEGQEGWAEPGLVARLIPECRSRLVAAYAAARAHAQGAGLLTARLAESLEAALEQHTALLDAYDNASADRSLHIPAVVVVAHAEATTRLLRLWPGEPAEADRWQVDVGRFRYGGGAWQLLDGKPMRLLHAFVTAKNHVLGHEQIRTLDDLYDVLEPYRDVSDLNKQLRKLLRLKANPIQPIYGSEAYRLDPPQFS